MLKLVSYKILKLSSARYDNFNNSHYEFFYNQVNIV